jgi:hypothetical protein
MVGARIGKVARCCHTLAAKSTPRPSAPTVSAQVAPRPRVDNAMVKALARAFRWRKMLDEGVHATLEDLARAKGVNATYVSRILRLTLLVPNIVEAILDGRQPAEMGLDALLRGFRWSGMGSTHPRQATAPSFPVA